MKAILIFLLLSCSISLGQTFKTPEGDIVKIDRPAVLKFWTTTCIPCIKDLPRFAKFKALYKNRDVIITPVLIQSNGPSIVTFNSIRQEKIITLIDDSYYKKQGVNQVPYLEIIDKNGNVVYKKYGEFDYNEIGKELDRLIKEQYVLVLQYAYALAGSYK